MCHALCMLLHLGVSLFMNPPPSPPLPLHEDQSARFTSSSPSAPPALEGGSPQPGPALALPPPPETPKPPAVPGRSVSDPEADAWRCQLPCGLPNNPPAPRAAAVGCENAQPPTGAPETPMGAWSSLSPQSGRRPLGASPPPCPGGAPGAFSPGMGLCFSPERFHSSSVCRETSDAGRPTRGVTGAASGRARPVPSGGGSGSVGGGSQVGCGARASGGAVAGGRSVQGVRARLWAAAGCEGAPSGKGLRRARCSRCSGHGEPRPAPPPRELVPCASAAECPLPLAQRHPAHL